MIEIYPNIFVGNDISAEALLNAPDLDDWYILHSAKEPYHRQFVGYAGRGAPKDSPEYLFACRGNRMALNMVDADNPEFFSKEMITAGLDFLSEGYGLGKKLLIHCNRGESRSPSMAMLFVHKRVLMAKVSINGNKFTINKACRAVSECYEICRRNKLQGRPPKLGDMPTYPPHFYEISFAEAEAEMKKIYPKYAPANGIRGHLQQYWGEY